MINGISEIHTEVDEQSGFSADEVRPSDDPAILDLVNALRTEGEDELRDYLLIGQRNEEWVSGNQWNDINPYNGQLTEAWQTYLPRVSQNYLRGLVNTFKARITQQRPSVTAFATSATPQAKQASQIAAKLIDYMEKEMQIDLQLDDVVRLATMHGTSGFKIIYNPASDRVEWKKLSIDDYLIDPTKEDYESADWVMFRTYISKYEAKALLKDQLNGQVPAETTYFSGGKIRSGVCVWEIWHKPTARVPEGLYAKVIEKYVADAMPYPYMVPSLETPGTEEAVLPIVVMKIDPKRGSQYGETWLTDCIPEQRMINEVEASLVSLRRKISNIKLVVESDAMRQAITTDSQILISAGGAVPQFMTPPQIPQLLFADRDHYVKKLYDIAGINDALVGTASAGGASGRALAYMDELDSMKHSGTSKSIESMLVRAWKLTLQLIQMYYLGDRVMRITADDGGFDTVSFQAADIQGITVDITPRSGKDRFAQSKVAQIEADAQAGIVDPKQIPEARITASATPITDSVTKNMIQRDVQMIMAGSEPQVNTQLDPTAAVAELANLHTALLSQGVPEHVLLAIEKLAEMYSQAGQPPAAPTPEAAPQPSPNAPGLPSAQGTLAPLT